MERAARAMWVWVQADAPPDADALAEFAARERVAEAFVSVPWLGPTADTRRCVRALRARGIRVSALGGQPSWAGGTEALAWARRAVAEGLFEGIHLDIEPWSRDDWPGREQQLLEGLASAARAVGEGTGLPVEVDLTPWLADEHSAGFRQVVRSADAVTLMAYRDRARDILATSDAARRLLAEAGRPYLLGVDTRPAEDPGTTFADDGGAVLERELSAVAAALAPDSRFAGIAIHDAAGWRALGG